MHWTEIKDINTPIVFHWKEKNIHKTLNTSFCYFRNYAIELLEQEQNDIVHNVYYTINNQITIKLEYYNFEWSL